MIHSALSYVLKALFRQRQNGFSEHRILIFTIWIVETNLFVKIRNSSIIDCTKWISFVKQFQWDYLVLILIIFRSITKDPYWGFRRRNDRRETFAAKVKFIDYEAHSMSHWLWAIDYGPYYMSHSMDPFW